MVIPTVIISVVISTMSGNAFGLMRFPGEKLLLILILVGLTVPFEATIISLWELVGQLGIRRMYWALIIPQAAMGFSFGTFWMRANFKGSRVT